MIHSVFHHGREYMCPKETNYTIDIFSKSNVLDISGELKSFPLVVVVNLESPRFKDTTLIFSGISQKVDSQF